MVLFERVAIQNVSLWDPSAAKTCPTHVQYLRTLWVPGLSCIPARCKVCNTAWTNMH